MAVHAFDFQMGPINHIPGVGIVFKFDGWFPGLIGVARLALIEVSEVLVFNIAEAMEILMAGQTLGF